MWEVHSGARWLVEAGERRNWNSSDNGKHLGKKDGGEKLSAKTKECLEEVQRRALVLSYLD